MEFQEGIHKSSRRETAPEPEQEPESKRPSKRWLLVLTVVVLVCVVVGGGIFAFQLVRNSHASGQVTLARPGWCSVQVTGLNTSVGIPKLNGIDAVSARDIWMAGYLVSQNSNTPNQAVIEHWNGTSLSVTPSPNSGENGSRLNAIAEVAPGNVWAVGSVLQTPQNGNDLGDFLLGIHTLIEHWNGQQWSIIPSPDGATANNSSNALVSISAISASDIWAVGSSSQGALIEHWDGNQWSMMSLPEAFHARSLEAVVAPAKDALWVAGFASAPVGQGIVPLLAHWNGQQWTQVSTLDKDFFLLSIQAFSPHDIWIGGEMRPHPGPTDQTILMHWDGTSLQQTTLPRLTLSVVQGSEGPVLRDQTAIVVRASNDIWVTGGGFGSALAAVFAPVFIEHWDGKSWHFASLPQAHVGQFTVLAVVGGKVWAAGTTYIGDQQTPAQLVEMSC